MDRSLSLYPLLLLALLPLACVLAPPQAQAHETIPADWCTAPGEQTVVVEELAFDEAALLDLQKVFGLHLHASPASDADKCGIVDRWILVNQILGMYCQAQSPGQSTLPVVSGPDSYFDKRHHELYRLADGVKGACLVCLPPKK